MDDRFPADVGDECPVNRDEYQEQQHGVQQFGDGRRVDEPIENSTKTRYAV